MKITKKMRAFHNDPKIKAKYMNRVKAHREADELITGIGWENGKGCAVGCTLNNYSHKAFETELGIPETLAHLEDAIFERLADGFKDGRHLAFPEQFLDSITLGADLSLVAPRFFLWLLSGEDSVIPKKSREQPLVKKAIGEVAILYREWVNTKIKPSDKRFNDAASAANDAAWAAANAVWAANDASDASAAASAAASDASAANDAVSAAACAAANTAWAAANTAWAAASAAAWAAAWEKMREKLIEFLSESVSTN